MHVLAVVRNHPNKPGFLMLLVAEVRRFIYQFNERLLNGFFDILFVPKVHHRYFKSISPYNS